MMKFRQLGRTNLKVSEVGFGCWAIGGTSYGPTEREESLRALEAAWQHKINFYDTADAYGPGVSELLVGEFLKGKPRDQVFVATKVGWDFYHEGGNRRRFDREHIQFACGESLKRLKTDYIDIYQLHNPSAELIRQGEAVGVLEELKKAGKIRFIGISVNREDEAIACIEDGRVDTIQLIFNMLDQRMAEKVLEKAQEAGVGIIAREPLACGVLTGKYKSGHQFTKDDHRRRWSEDKFESDLKKIELIRTILATERISLTRAALEYVLDFKAVGVVIPGAKTEAQVLENALASEDPGLRIQEASHFRDIYKREDIFRQYLLPS